VIPIYGRGGNEDPRAKTKEQAVVETIPSGPSGQRPAPVIRNPMAQNPAIIGTGHQGLGFIPTLFGLQGSQGQGGYAEPLTPEQQHQAFLSRLLLMLGSFVIMCCECVFFSFRVFHCLPLCYLWCLFSSPQKLTDCIIPPPLYQPICSAPLLRVNAFHLE